MTSRGVVHTFKNAGDQPSRMLISATPSGFEKFFARCAEEFAKAGGPNMARIIEIGVEHGIHFVLGWRGGPATGRWLQHHESRLNQFRFEIDLRAGKSD